MAVTKRFIALQSALVAEKTNETAIEAGVLAVMSVYSGADTEMALLLLNDTPQYIRKAFAGWLRNYGVIVNEPKVGTSAYSIGNAANELVKDKAKQHKIFNELKSSEVKDVLKQEMKVATEKKAKKLEGTPAQRAGKKIASVVAAMKKDGDIDGAAYLNDKFSAHVETKIVKESAVEFGLIEGDKVFELSSEEVVSLAAYLMKLRTAEAEASRLAA